MAEISIEVADEDEGKLIKAGLEDQAVRAFVKIIAALKPLPDDDTRMRAVEASCILLGETFPKIRRR